LVAIIRLVCGSCNLIYPSGNCPCFLLEKRANFSYLGVILWSLPPFRGQLKRFPLLAKLSLFLPGKSLLHWVSLTKKRALGAELFESLGNALKKRKNCLRNERGG